MPTPTTVTWTPRIDIGDVLFITESGEYIGTEGGKYLSAGLDDTEWTVNRY